MKFHLVLRALGLLVTLVGASMLVAFFLGLTIPRGATYSEAVDLKAWLTAAGITISSGLLLYTSGRFVFGNNEPNVRLFRREAIAVVGLGWITCSLFAALPFLFCTNSSVTHAWFEACSGLTTTGSSIFPDLESLPKTILFWRSICQWLGGMGILGAFLLIFTGETRGKTMLSLESSIHGSDLSTSNLRSAMHSLWFIYISFTILCAIGLVIQDMNLFQALNHAMATVATGGFSPQNDSVASFSLGVKYWLCLFMFLCGISLPIYVSMYRKKDAKVILRHEETRWFSTIILAAALILTLHAAAGYFEADFADILFTTISIITSTGFGTADYTQWSSFAQGFILLLMITGGCAGSTSGGLKISRVILWLRMLKNEILHGFRPNQVLRLRINGVPVSESAGRQVFIVLSLAAVFMVFGSITVRLLEPTFSTMACLSSVVTTLSNGGPAFAELGPASNFSTIQPPTAILLGFFMILGRLEYIALLALFTVQIWKKY